MDNIKNDKYYVKKIVTDLNFIVEHTSNLSQEEFQQEEVLVDSMMFRLIQVSECSDKLTTEFKNTHSSIQWRAMKGLRNRIVHEYGNIDFSVVFNTIRNDIPQLLSELTKIKL